VDYLLVVLTHGADPEPLRRTLDAFRENVRPLPTAALIHVDGPGGLDPRQATAIENDWTEWRLIEQPEPVGFCAATRRAWSLAAASTLPYVFWLEHDFEITRPVDLEPIGWTLDAYTDVAQIALMRDAVNDQERAAGGLYESRPGQYDDRLTAAPDPVAGVSFWPWLSHRSYFTTNPSLMRTAWMAENPWPDYESECEGRFGIDLVARGFRFGVWGEGDPWCRHVGQRSGFGY
jgi:hypothetical protein